MHGHHFSMKQGSLFCCTSNRMRNVMKLEIEEDPILAVNQLPDKVRACTHEEFKTYLKNNGQTFQLLDEFKCSIRSWKIQSYNEVRFLIMRHVNFLLSVTPSKNCAHI